MSKISDKVEALARPVVEEEGCKLWSVEYIKEAGTWYLRIFIDKDGGVGIAEFDGIENCAELQKLYLDDSVKGKGCGKGLMQIAEDWARSAGYKNLYLETHTNLSAALKLYEKTGFHQIEKPCSTPHGTMNRFYLKEL